MEIKNKMQRFLKVKSLWKW